MASDTEHLDNSELTTSEIAMVAVNEKAGLVSQLACHFCGMQFDVKKTRSLRAHIEEVHVLGDSGYMCGICCEEFTSRKAVESHMSTCHRAPKSLGCGTCGETFRMRILLLKHLDSHTEEQIDNNKVGLCYCGECFEFFDSVMSLQAHVMNHKEQAVFVCGACGLQTEHRHIMVKHLEVHVLSNILSAKENTETESSEHNNFWASHVHLDESRIQRDVVFQQSIDDLSAINGQLCTDDFENEEASYKCGVCHACFTSLAEAVAHAGTHQDEQGTMQQVEINVLMEEKTDMASSVVDETLAEAVPGIEAAVKTELLPTETLNH